MKSSWQIAKVAGIDIYIHVTFPILLAWVALSEFLPRRSWWDAAEGLIFIGLLFVIVVLHELGHALMAKRHGIRTRDITLLPIGGVARLERIPEDPQQELQVALAGPVMNVALAFILYVTIFAGGLLSPVTGVVFNDANTFAKFLWNLLWVNVYLVLFNLLPAFPMDGGRVLRALLAMRMEYVRATQIAATLGQGMAWVFALLGLLSNPLLIFIALLVWIGAASEASMVQMRSALAGIPVSHVMVRHFQKLAPEASLAQVVDHIRSGYQLDFPVVEDDRVVGMLTRSDLVAAFSQHGIEAEVSRVAQTSFETAEPGEMVEQVFGRMQNCECPSLPVLRDGRLVGIVTKENIGEFIMIQAALDRDGATSQRGKALRPNARSTFRWSEEHPS
jgi:Zn-dependent protease/predicted transcriptional regulator